MVDDPYQFWYGLCVVVVVFVGVRTVADYLAINSRFITLTTCFYVNLLKIEFLGKETTDEFTI